MGAEKCRYWQQGRKNNLKEIRPGEPDLSRRICDFGLQPHRKMVRLDFHT